MKKRSSAKNIKVEKLSKDAREELVKRYKNKYAEVYDKRHSFRVYKIVGVYTHGFIVKNHFGSRHRIPFEDVRGIYKRRPANQKTFLAFDEVIKGVIN